MAVRHLGAIGQREDGVGVCVEPHGTVQRFHSGWFLYTSKQQLEQLGSVPGEWGTLLQPNYLQQTLLCPQGLLHSVVCGL